MSRAGGRLRPSLLLALIGLALPLLGACAQTDVGACDDPDLARTVVYVTKTPPGAGIFQGLPAYEGQAMVQMSCSPGTCHTDGVTGAGRRGVPLGYDFSLPLASPEVLAESQARILDHADLVYGLVESGDMPPFGPGAEGAFDGAVGYSYANGDRVPAIDSIEGLERFRNWIACGAPVVENIEGTGTVGDIVPALTIME